MRRACTINCAATENPDMATALAASANTVPAACCSIPEPDGRPMQEGMTRFSVVPGACVLAWAVVACSSSGEDYPIVQPPNDSDGGVDAPGGGSDAMADASPDAAVD